MAPYIHILERGYFMRKTKIICTLGPSTDDENVVRQLMLSGMNVARFNFSHQTHTEHKAAAGHDCEAAEELNLPVATLLDTKGPEIRLHKIKNGKAVLKRRRYLHTAY